MRSRALITLSVLALTVSACDSGEDASTQPEPAAAAEAEGTEEAPAAEPELTEEEKEAKQREQLAERLNAATERARKKYDDEAKRFEDNKLEDAVAKLAGKHKNTKKAMAKILASAHREPGNADRDQYRHPAETLDFFGVKPSSVVVEAGPGAGWYTEILAPLLAAKGKLVLPVFDAKGPDYEFPTFLGRRAEMMLGKSDALYGKVERVANTKYEEPTFGPDGSADVVIVTREMHNWHRNGVMDAWVGAARAVLKPGGTLAIVQHRAPEGANPDESSQKGRLDQKWLVEKIEAAGFSLAGESEINANPKDTKDYERGVWTLPPAMALGDKDKDKYLEVGESDRMTLKFTKK